MKRSSIAIANELLRDALPTLQVMNDQVSLQTCRAALTLVQRAQELLAQELLADQD